MLHISILSNNSHIKSGIILTALCLSILFTFSAEGQGIARPSPGKKLSDSGDKTTVDQNIALGFDSSLTDLIEQSSSNSNYDPHTIWVLESLTDVTQPFWDPRDVDLTRNRRAVSKALTIQSSVAASSLVKGSELRPTFMSVKRGLDDVKKQFNYSLQDDGDFFAVSREKHGRKLLELNMEFNVSQGLDPQIRIGQSTRFRYDLVNSRPILEYGYNF